MYTGPNIVTDGLVLALDAANNKSYISGSTTWNDLSGNNNSGSLTNVPAFSSANNGSLVFNGTNQSVNSSNSTSLNVGNTISVFSWFYVNSLTGYQPIAAKSVLNTGWEMANNAGTFRCTLRPTTAGSNNITVGSLSIGNWYYGGFTCNNTTIRLYLNNAETGNTSASSLTLDTAGLLYIAQRNDTVNINFFNGNIANVQIYNRALSTLEIQQNYNGQKSRFNL